MDSIKEAEKAVLVDEQFACPNCGNRDSDELVWMNETDIECQLCGIWYAIEE